MLGIGELLDGRYRVGPLVGRGGMADVHRGEDLATGEPVAIKRLRRPPDPARWSSREIGALSRLDHPAVVRLRAWGFDGTIPYLVLDLVEGGPLSEVVAGGALAVSQAVGVVADVAAGLAHAHARGVIHRDVKPSNILIDRAGRPHLVDFGIARLADATATTAGLVMGTAAYLAPEQVRAERVGPAADVYALGLVLLECLTGERAFPGTFSEAAAAHLLRDPAVPPSISPALRTLIGAATAREPTDRPPAAALAAALRSQLAFDSQPLTTVVVAPDTRVLPAGLVVRPDRRRRTPVLAAVALTGGVLVGGAFLAGRGGGAGPLPSRVTVPTLARDTSTTVRSTASPRTTTLTTPRTTARATPATVAPTPATTKANHRKGHRKEHDKDTD
jgi:serine/threonine protein kinase